MSEWFGSCPYGIYYSLAFYGRIPRALIRSRSVVSPVGIRSAFLSGCVPQNRLSRRIHRLPQPFVPVLFWLAYQNEIKRGQGVSLPEWHWRLKLSGRFFPPISAIRLTRGLQKYKLP